VSKKLFGSISLRVSLMQEVAQFIKSHPDFVNANPEINSVAGFIDKATRAKLSQLKKTRLVEA
jgi:hypothetical protein